MGWGEVPTPSVDSVLAEVADELVEVRAKLTPPMTTQAREDALALLDTLIDRLGP
jgi:hypothetical protein